MSLTCLLEKLVQNKGLGTLKHSGSEGRTSHETAPKNCLTCLLKSWKTSQKLSPTYVQSNVQSKGLGTPKYSGSEGRTSHETDKPLNSAEKLPNVSSEIPET